MEAIPTSLTGASAAALDALSGAAGRVASPASGGSERAMAGAARTAIFADAVLGAIHARLEELKAVAK